MNKLPDQGEWFVILWSTTVAVLGLQRYYSNLRLVSKAACWRWQRLSLFVAPPLAGLILLELLLRFAAREVRSGGAYQWLFMAFGIAWILLMVHFGAWLGVSLREDALERHNGAAVIAVNGVWFGFLFAYAGGNIGEGETIWMTFFSSGLATAGLFLLWLLFEVLTRISLAVTEERDAASGWRLAGFLTAQGLIMGRAVAGDWQSAGATIRDFAVSGWPALVLTGVAVVVERKLQPTFEHPSHSQLLCGVAPAAVYLVAALALLFELGKW